ncbi:MAG: selenium cofactor biosynthesis protein YqeC [Actinomycetota bacterium]|nr:selenium cofactor biosynthesis protein YqeC [Actinomycetota bacterium]
MSGLSVPVPIGSVADALGCGLHEHVALVGGGGKSTLLHALGLQLPGRRILTTTTKMGADQHRGHPVLIGPTDAEIEAVEAAAVVFSRTQGSKAVGVAPSDCDRWFRLADHVIVEADGARHHPFKAPRPFEPIVPDTCTMLVSVIGADALGRVIADQCHRPLRVAALAGCSPYVRLTPDAAATVILHERGARREQPASARLAVVITKVDGPSAQLAADLVAAIALAEPAVTTVQIQRF